MAETAKNSSGKTNIIKWLICFIFPAVLLLIPCSEAYTITIKIYMAATVCAIAIWATEVMDFLIPALVLPAVYVIGGVATSAQVFASWGQSTVWVIFGGMLFCVVFEEVGFMNRMAYWCIIKAGCSYRGILVGLTVSGFLLSLLIPTVSGRVALYAVLTYGLCKALDLTPESNVAAGIMIGGFFAANYTAYLYPTGSNITLIGLNSLAEYGYNVSWGAYMLHNAPITVVSALLMAIGLSFVLPKDENIKGKEFFVEQYKSLDSISIKEKKFILILMIAVILLATNSLHHIDAAWIFIISSALCFVPAFKIVPSNCMKKINFPMLIFIASCMSIGACAKACGASEMVSTMIGPFLTAGGKVYTVAIIWVSSVILNFLMTPMAAISAMTNPFIEIAMQANINPIPIVYTFIQGLDQFIFPYEVAPALLMFAYGMINMKQFMKTFALKGVFNIIFILLIAMPYWAFIGLL